MVLTAKSTRRRREVGTAKAMFFWRVLEVEWAKERVADDVVEFLSYDGGGGADNAGGDK